MTVYHNHHIIPRHMNGSNDPSNIKRTEEQNKANSERQIGKVFSEDHKRKLSEWKRSPEHLENLRQGRVNTPQSDHQKASAAKALSKDWKIITPSGDSFIITNLKLWAKENGLDQANLARGGNGTHKGYKAIRQ